MDEQPSFERAAIEADIKKLASEIKTQRERAEMKDSGGQEIIKEAIRSFPDFSHDENRAQQPNAASQPADDNSPLPAYAQSAPAAVKLEIEYLLDLALRKGISAGLTESKKSSYFVQDAFHDALAGRLYPELKRQGIVE